MTDFDWDNFKVVCSECGSSQPRKYVENNVFGQELCKFCGGVTLVAGVEFENKEIVEDIASQRGIGNG